MLEILLPTLGILFAGTAVLYNDAVQTLGTFMSSNKKISWQKLWAARERYIGDYHHLGLVSKQWRY